MHILVEALLLEGPIVEAPIVEALVAKEPVPINSTTRMVQKHNMALDC